MAFRIEPGQPIGKEARRVLIEQIERAEKRLRSGEDRAVSVHEARKHFKRFRAGLRLLRPAIGENAYQRENAAMRDTARLLAGARDAHVQLQTLAKIEAEHGLDRESDTRELRHALETQATENSATTLDAAIKDALGRLKSGRGRVAKLKIAADADLIARGLKRGHREARNALEEARADPSDETWHELRKCVQRHWRQMGLLNAAWPEYFGARAKAAKHLSALLGDDHDLAVLAAHLDGPLNQAVTRERAEAVKACARKSQSRLRSIAIMEADRLLSDRPADFARRFVVAWRTARLLTAAAADSEGRESGHAPRA